ncbi:LamG-like jellyroll fold domain-containing protein [Spirosoma endbachense]|uniref:PKD domain-containing protein n=1 Tax=Spirosoma endbachense TaxID=2666025 RepID=A0A6P1VZM9_9BACT|nr:LamG-like jellyroll fold domain-containing protein [Spirosoma endbachense]QHV96856.1 PKD domain-containing protein [Spirosoma endbachense]
MTEVFEKFSIIFIFLFFSTQLIAQKNKIFNIPKNIEEPDWVKKVDWNNPNVFVIDSLIKESKKVDLSSKKDDQKNEIDDEIDEEPYEVAFERWVSQNRAFIQSDGSVKIDIKLYKTLQSEFEKNKAQARKGTSLPTNSGSWSLLGPVQTFSDNNRGLKNYQVNITRIAIAPSDSTILYAGSSTGILFKSIDKGLNWYSINDNLLSGSIGAIAVSPGNANLVYAYSDNVGLLKTTDGGANWTTLASFTQTSVNKILVQPNGNVIVAAQNNIYLSSNGGTSWKIPLFLTSPVPNNIPTGTKLYDIVYNQKSPDILTAVGASSADTIKFFYSTDGGISFSEKPSPANTFSRGARLATTNSTTIFPDIIYCITLQNDFPKLVKSTDFGQTWSVVTTFTGTGLSGRDTTNGMSNGQGFYDLAIMMNPTNADHLIVGTTSAWKSTDGGVNFKPIGGYIGSFPLHPDMQSMVANGTDSYITTDGGVVYSSDFFSETANLSIRHKGLSGSDYWGFDQGWAEDIVVGGRYHNGNGALYEPYGSGNTLSVGGGENATGHVFPTPGKKGKVGFKDIGTKIIPQSLAGKIENADIQNQKWPSVANYGQFSSKLIVHPNYSNIFYVGYNNSLWKSEDNGLTYYELKDFGANVWRYDMSKSNPNKIYLVTTTGLWKTTDGGNTWSQLFLPSGVTFKYYNSDIVVNPDSEDIIWFCQKGGTASNKVFKSVDAGNTWVNYTDTLLKNKNISFLVAQGGTNSGIYAIQNTPNARVYYRDNNLTEWVDYNSGLPQNFEARQGGIIFYRDNKLRLAGNRGIWESPLYSVSSPMANPMANKRIVSCEKDTITFTDYSILNYSGASWKWAFPGASYVNDINAREPKVTYPGPGLYTVSLTVKNNRDSSSTRTVNNMINFNTSLCLTDTLPGKALSVSGKRKEINIGIPNINSNSFSISCWIKPKGKQKSFSQILGEYMYPNSNSGFGLGFSFNGYTDNLNLCYTDNIVTYRQKSKLIADSTQWNHVVLVYSPTNVKIYLNGVAEIVNAGPMPVINLSTKPFFINPDIHNQGGNYQGEIDEVKFYNYALSQTEIREKKHLILREGTAENGLIKYIQFNQADPLNPRNIWELVSGKLITLTDSNYLIPSTAPIASGQSFSKDIAVGGQHTFTGTGIDLFWPNIGTFPNGQVVAFRLNSAPDSNPDSISYTVPNKGYFIINNYGSNATFTPLQKIRLSKLSLPENSKLANFNLYKRPSNSFDRTTWLTKLGNAIDFTYAANSESSLEFSGETINSFSQFLISINNNICVNETLKSGNWNDPTVWSCSVVPGVGSLVKINRGHIIEVPNGVIAQPSFIELSGKIMIRVGGIVKLNN